MVSIGGDIQLNPANNKQSMIIKVIEIYDCGPLNPVWKRALPN